jgi:hypothetical protein
MSYNHRGSGYRDLSVIGRKKTLGVKHHKLIWKLKEFSKSCVHTKLVFKCIIF